MFDETLREGLERSLIDVEHADHWIDHVVLPLVAITPDIIPDLVIGVKKRMKYAGLVSNRMYRLLA